MATTASLKAFDEVMEVLKKAEAPRLSTEEDEKELTEIPVWTEEYAHLDDAWEKTHLAYAEEFAQPALMDDIAMSFRSMPVKPTVIPSWVNNGAAKNHDWQTIVRMAAAAYSMNEGGSTKVTDTVVALAQDGWDMIEQSTDYIVYKHPGDQSAVMAVVGTRIGSGSSLFSTFRDLASDMMIVFGAEQVMPRVRKINKALEKLWASGEIAREKTVICGHSLGGTVTLMSGNALKLKGIAFNAGGLGSFASVTHEELAFVHIKNDPISKHFGPSVYDKSVDLGYSIFSGLEMKAHSMSNFYKVTYDMVKSVK